jgi:hypothetical protein
MTSKDDHLQDEAFLASVRSVSKNIEAYGREILDLGDDEGLDWAPEGEPACLLISSGRSLIFPALCIEDSALDGPNPKVALNTLGRAIDILAFARTWKEAGTTAPPVSLIGTSKLTQALLEIYGIEPQDFLDRVWEVTKISPRYSETSTWRSEGDRGKLISKEFEGYTIRDLPTGAPWMAGYSSLTSLMMETIQLRDDVVIHWRPQKPNIIELRLASSLPLAMTSGFMNKPFAKVLEHPIAEIIDARVVKIEQLKASTRISLKTIEPMETVRLGKKAKDRNQYKRERSRLSKARGRLQEYVVHQLTPPTKTPNLALVDEDVDKLGI